MKLHKLIHTSQDSSLTFTLSLWFKPSGEHLGFHERVCCCYI